MGDKTRVGIRIRFDRGVGTAGIVVGIWLPGGTLGMMVGAVARDGRGAWSVWTVAFAVGFLGWGATTRTRDGTRGRGGTELVFEGGHSCVEGRRWRGVKLSCQRREGEARLFSLRHRILRDDSDGAVGGGV